MTTFHLDKVTCSECGVESEQRVIASTNALGSPDLDLRPPPMRRSTISHWLQACPNCSLVSSDLSEKEPGLGDILTSERYRSLERSGTARELINRCLRRSLIDEHLGDIAQAAEHALWAAWAADDAGDPSSATYRAKAADLFLAATADQPVGSQEAMVRRARLIDILRRSERWDEAVRLADTLLATDGVDPTIGAVARYGRSLAQRHDAARHTVQDSMDIAVKESRSKDIKLEAIPQSMPENANRPPVMTLVRRVFQQLFDFLGGR